MEIIKITPNMVFMLEVDGKMTENERDAILKSWKSLIPDRPLLIAVKNSIKILEIENVQDANGSQSGQA